jgi:hypothetical protein
MLKDLLKGIKKRAAFGVENVMSARGRLIDNDNLKVADRVTRSAINKTGQAFASRRLGNPQARGYDDLVKRVQKRELKQAGDYLQKTSENKRKRVERLEELAR